MYSSISSHAFILRAARSRLTKKRESRNLNNRAVILIGAASGFSGLSQ